MALRFLKSQLLITPHLPTTSFASQTIIITGSNTGIGLESARHFVRLGASTVILAVRSLSSGAAAKASIEKSTGCSSDVVRVMHLDMTSYASVLSFAESCMGLDRIDVAVLNAGVNRRVWEVSEGHESTLTINVFSTFLLAQALIPKMEETGRKWNSRTNLVVTGSEVHEFAQFPERMAPSGEIFEWLDQPRQQGTGKDVDLGNRYMLSKLLQLLCARAMASSLTQSSNSTESNVVITVANPGLCRSSLSRECGWGMYLLELLLARTAEVGSRSVVAAASVGREETGGEGMDKDGIGAKASATYVSDGVVADVAAWVESAEGRETQERVWEEVRREIERVMRDFETS